MTIVRGKPRPLPEEERIILDAMTEKQIHENALNDPDNPPITEKQLNRMKRKYYEEDQETEEA